MASNLEAAGNLIEMECVGVHERMKFIPPTCSAHFPIDPSTLLRTFFGHSKFGGAARERR